MGVEEGEELYRDGKKTAMGGTQERGTGWPPGLASQSSPDV